MSTTKWNDKTTLRTAWSADMIWMLWAITTQHDLKKRPNHLNQTWANGNETWKYCRHSWTTFIGHPCDLIFPGCQPCLLHDLSHELDLVNAGPMPSIAVLAESLMKSRGHSLLKTLSHHPPCWCRLNAQCCQKHQLGHGTWSPPWMAALCSPGN